MCFLRQRTSVVLLAIVPSALCRAQGPGDPFEVLSIQEGLSQSTVNCMVQDREGYMWFGTEDGLNRYDGYRFTVYKHDPQDPTSLSDNYVASLCIDSTGAHTHSRGMPRTGQAVPTSAGLQAAPPVRCESSCL